MEPHLRLLNSTWKDTGKRTLFSVVVNDHRLTLHELAPTHEEEKHLYRLDTMYPPSNPEPGVTTQRFRREEPFTDLSQALRATADILASFGW